MHETLIVIRNIKIVLRKNIRLRGIAKRRIRFRDEYQLIKSIHFDQLPFRSGTNG